jgi:retron-type reverse transcriptase
MTRTSSLREKPRSHWPRRLSDWLNPTGARKVHSLVDKVYKRKNLLLAWEKVRRNGGSGGVDGQNLEEFRERLEEHLDRLHEELKMDTYRPQPVRQHLIPKAGQPGKFRVLGIPTCLDRFIQQAML